MFSASNADAKLNQDLGGEATPHILLHTGDPGADGTANVAVYDGGPIARKAATFGSPEDHPDEKQRRCKITDDVAWDGSEIDSGQTITHVTVWDASSGPGLLYVGTLKEGKTTGSDGILFPAGELTVGIKVWELSS